MILGNITETQLSRLTFQALQKNLSDEKISLINKVLCVIFISMFAYCRQYRTAITNDVF